MRVALMLRAWRPSVSLSVTLVNYHHTSSAAKSGNGLMTPKLTWNHNIHPMIPSSTEEKDQWVWENVEFSTSSQIISASDGSRVALSQHLPSFLLAVLCRLSYV